MFDSVLYRTYSKKKSDGQRESYPEICDRVVPWVAEVGKLTEKEQRRLDKSLRAMEIIVAGRILWVGGTEWSEDPDNVYGGYNCNSTIMDSPGAFGRLMNLAMQGVGTGAVLEESVIEKLPAVRNRLVVTIQGKPGDTPKTSRRGETSVTSQKGYNRGVESPKHKTIVIIKVGDSRQGWCASYQALVDLAFKSDAIFGSSEIHVVVDVSDVRPYGERLRRFGGVANPVNLSEMYLKIADLINGAQGRQLTSVECCLLIDEAASTIVSGNIRRCLSKNTLVQTEKGLVPISGVEVGDRVLTSKGYQSVTNKFRQGLQSIWVIHTDGLGTIECSGDHKVAVANPKNKGYQMVKTKDICVDDRIVTVQESNAKTYVGSVKIVKIEPNLFAKETYDLEVEKLHQFVVGEGLLVSNSAGMRQYSWHDELFGRAKQNLWQQDAHGNWKIDPKRDALRMANHSRVYHHKPPIEECIDAVRKQYLSGEGAIQWAREAIVRANADILQSKAERDQLLNIHEAQVKEFLRQAHIYTYKEPPTERELQHRCDRIGLNPCGEIIGADMHCNLTEVILPLLSPTDLAEQDEAFGIAAIAVAALLHQKFPDEVYQYSREIDPIVAVCPTGIFDFFVLSLGVKWLQWWQADRNPNWLQPTIPPQVEEVCEVLGIVIEDYGNNAEQPEFDLGAIFDEIEKRYYTRWRKAVESSLTEYCDRHKLRRPNRYTAVQPSGTKSLLVNVSPGWHPPKAKRFIRRITFGKNDPVALTCIDCGYNVVPGQSDKDENGNLLNDPFDPRCSEWLVEIPCAVAWADLPNAEAIDIEKFSAKAQLRAYKNVQGYYTTHNTSGTIELREHEIEELGTMIYEDILDNRGYLSVTLLARFDDRQSFPRLPFEQVTQQKFEELSAAVLDRRKTEDFLGRLFHWDSQTEQEQDSSNSGPAGCDSDTCLLPGKTDEPEVVPKGI
jgi:hypothetical protein